MTKRAASGLSTKNSQNTPLPLEHQRLPQGIRILQKGGSQAANAKDAACHLASIPKQQMGLLRPLIPN